VSDRGSPLVTVPNNGHARGCPWIRDPAWKIGNTSPCVIWVEAGPAQYAAVVTGVDMGDRDRPCVLARIWHDRQVRERRLALRRVE
jgi:hypothetical protein